MEELGRTVAVGLLADTEELKRLRSAVESPTLAPHWKRLIASLDRESTSTEQLEAWTFAAAVTRSADYAGVACDLMRKVIALPDGNSLHAEAACMTLGGMHRAQQLSLAIDWLWPLLDRELKQAAMHTLIAQAVENRLSTPASIPFEDDGGGRLLLVRRMDTADPWCLHPHPHQTNNWDLWFCSTILMAAELAERAYFGDTPLTPPADIGYEVDADCIARWRQIARKQIETAFAQQVGEDGDYAEGINYAAYGGRALALCLRLTKRQFDLNLCTPAVGKLPAWIASQWLNGGLHVFNFNDARLDYRPAPTLMAAIASRTRDPQTQGILYKTLESCQDPLPVSAWCALDVKLPAHPWKASNHIVFRKTGTSIWRHAHPAGEIVMATQGGAFGGAHQHADRGNFWISGFGDFFAVDTGDGRHLEPPSTTYALTESHNCCLVDRCGQAASNQLPTTARLLEHSSGSTWYELGPCYESEASIRRRFCQPAPSILIVADAAAEASSLTWFLQGYNADGKSRWECGDRWAKLHRPSGVLCLYFLEEVTGMQTSSQAMDYCHDAIQRFRVERSGGSLTVLLILQAADEEEIPVTRLPDALHVKLPTGEVLLTREPTSLQFGESRWEV